jgi:hypothetical protein
MFAYLVYPRRIVLSAMLMIVFFGCVYVVLDVAGGPLSSVTQNVGQARGDWGTFSRAFWSAATFTTLGYDGAPTGPPTRMRVLSTIEALVGALYLSMITAATARQMMRR